MMNINSWYGQRYGWLALLVVMVCVLIGGHGRVVAAESLVFWGDDTFIVDGVRGRAFTVAGIPRNEYQMTPKIVVIDTQTGSVQNSDFFPLLGTSPVEIAFDHQRNWLLIDELTRITVINADSGAQIYQLEGTFDEGDKKIATPQIDSELGVAWLFRSGWDNGAGNEPNTQPARVIAMNLLNGAHIEERVQPIEICCFYDSDDGVSYPETSFFDQTYYDPTTKKLHYTYPTELSSSAMGFSESYQLVTLDASSLGKVGEAPIPYKEWTASKGFDAVVFNGQIHGVSSGHPSMNDDAVMSWMWNDWTMVTYPSERPEGATISNATSHGIAIDIQRGLLVEMDGIDILIREAGSRNIIGVVDMLLVVEQTSMLMGHDPITDNLIFLDWKYGDDGQNRSFFTHSMADLIAMSRPWTHPDVPDADDGQDTPPEPDDTCVIPDSGPWPPCATEGDNPPPPPPPTNGDDCIIPPSGSWPPCATGSGGAPTPPENDDTCVIPDAGPWPPCATGGGW